MKHLDLAFIGLGAAAMGLAAQLQQRNSALSAVFIEPNAPTRNDRTWCGWATQPHPFSHLATQRWTQWRVSHAGDVITQQSSELAYEMLQAGVVRDYSLKLINAQPHWETRLDAALATAEQTDTGWRLHLDSGEVINARWVLDARPSPMTLTRPWLWQSFVGVELECANSIDTSTVGLMDFCDDPQPLLSFVYSLPMTAHRCLIEYTRFSPKRADEAELRARLTQWCAEQGLADAQVMRREAGHLPMAPVPADAKDQWLRVGAAGGSLRPATGYAFHAIQTWASACADALERTGAPIVPKRARHRDGLDGIFLEALWDDTRAPATLFMRLFQRTPAAALARFLMSRPRALDTLAVLWALPKARMLAAAFRYLRQRVGI